MIGHMLCSHALLNQIKGAEYLTFRYEINPDYIEIISYQYIKDFFTTIIPDTPKKLLTVNCNEKKEAIEYEAHDKPSKVEVYWENSNQYKIKIKHKTD